MQPHHLVSSSFQRLLHVSLALLLLATPACSNNSLPMAPQLANETGSELFSIAIEAPQTYVAQGETLSLLVSGEDDRGQPIDVTASAWKSGNVSIATVSADGTVSGLQPGKVKLTATTKTPPREATVEITVLAPGQQPPADALGTLPKLPDADGTLGSPPLGTAPIGFAVDPNAPSPPPGVGLSIYPTVPRVAPGQSIRLVALQGEVGFQSPTAVVWRSSNPEVATVDEAGVVTAKSAGNVAILANSMAYPALTQRVDLAVINPQPTTAISGIRISPSRVTMNVGETFWLAAEVPTWEGGFDPQIRWETGDPNIALVSATGQVTATGPGATVITAIASGYTRGDLAATIPVEVHNAATGRPVTF